MWKEIVMIIILALTGFNWVYWQVLVPDSFDIADASFNLFIQIIGTALAVLILDQLWFAEERSKWKKIKEKVY